MGWDDSFQSIITIPTGATSGQRIVIDGTTGEILVYDSGDDLIAEISPDIAPDGFSQGGFYTRGFQFPFNIYSFLSGGRIQFGPVDGAQAAFHAHLEYDANDSAPDFSLLTMTTGNRAPATSPARIVLTSQDTVEPRVRVDGGSSLDTCHLDVTGNVTVDEFLTCRNIITGSVTITPSAANTPTSSTVTYPSIGTTPVRGYATANSTVPGTSVLGVSVSSVADTSMLVWLTRANTNATSVFYQVIGGMG